LRRRDRQARRRFGADILCDPTIDPLRSMDDLATQSAAMDLVVSVDNSTVHMAGALGVPVWVLLAEPPEWRWMRERDDTPCYPSARLFRQTRAQDWEPVVAAVARRLSEELAGGPAAAASLCGDSG